ncbi:MAG TPA: polyribonucleotide nucleotidyltransferase [Gammaproteobacteria bacterium]|nr:polyribonucleotide nucleotidyltransferase [Gammaproteobacteria bacterium]
MNPIYKEFQFGNDTVVMETNKVAKQATGSVTVTIGNTVVLTTVVGAKSPRPGQDFFPLTVNYQEKTYAAGKIPGGFFRREGRPSEKETLTCRLIDRPIRPLFPKGFMNEVQVVCTVLSADKDQDPDIAAMIGTSAALAISGIPFNGPLGAARVGYIDGNYILNPGYETLKESMLSMTVAGTESAVLMVESEAKEMTEDEMLGAVLFGHQEMQAIIKAVAELAAEAGKEAWDWQAAAKDESLQESVASAIKADLGEAYRISDKMERQTAVSALRHKAVEQLAGDDAQYSSDDVSDTFARVEKDLVRQRVLNGEPRIDGRDLRTVRPIEVEVGVLPKAHGSALFTRGETQALVVATLGTLRDAALIDALEGSYKDTFMLHYNFPPYSVGEAGFMSGPKRREIGHGKLARRGVSAALPNADDFPYTIRVVSEITESNGSSSMASVCGTSLALMDAGVPVTAPVAGVAMGLVKEGNRYAVLTDILGDEDHLGDMDFKVAGTNKGVTALQMDIKIEGITEEIMEAALAQAHEARIHILGEMNKVISESRAELSDNAPAMVTMNVHPDKIRDIIGKGGATIRQITEESGATVDIDDDGTVKVFGQNAAARDAAIEMIQSITAEAEVGAIYTGKVARIVDFGAFVTILPGKDGLVHISQIAEERVENVADYLSEGQEVQVKVLDVDQRGRIKLSMREVADDAAEVAEPADAAEPEEESLAEE